MNVQQYFRVPKAIVSGGLAYTPPLDVYGTGIWAAWSPTRLLSSSYTGYAVRMTDSGNVNTYEIPFGTDGLVDPLYVQNLSQSIGSRLRAILEYDQSGNGHHKVITGSGANYTEAGFPYSPYMLNGKLVLTGANFSISTATFTNNSVKSCFDVISGNGSSLARTIGTRVGSTGWIQRVTGSVFFFAMIGGASYNFSVTNSVSAQLITGFTYNSGNVPKYYKNGSLIATGGAVSGGTNSSTLTNFDSTGVLYNMQEQLMYTTDESSNAAGIQTNQNAFYGTY